MSEIALPKYSKAEEIMNAVTHGIGIALSIAGVVINTERSLGNITLFKNKSS